MKKQPKGSDHEIVIIQNYAFTVPLFYQAW